MRISDWSSDVCSSDLTEGEAEYKALILQANKARGDDFYALRLSYTLSSLKNDTDDINFRAANSNDFSTEWGPSANDRRHVISAVGYLYPLEGLTLSMAGLFQSGQPVNLVPDARIFGTQDLNGDGASFGENRSEERREGKGCVHKWKARWSAAH